MEILIIEDETHAARRLENLLLEIDPSIAVVGRMDSVKNSVSWFDSNPVPDLVFMDIQLGDGLSFEIFERAEVRAPVVFTTAYDEYALKAFKVNSIDYILKPVDKSELKGALQKYNRLTGSNQNTRTIMENISQVVAHLKKRYKERFVLKVGEHLKTVEVKDILYIMSQEKATICVTNDGRSHILDFTLDQLQELVNPEVFYRINRKYLVRSNSIEDIVSHSNSRLKLILKSSKDSEIIVARERVAEFKSWLDR
jgi:DNA-binding LytR/AlgR family response regulator